ncbi:hypothetical protein BDQ17DRAFT_1385795 [Cyathus striatus]|nr:hypothetical protein BDQ17DRAFT_1385795 [Cyathus striatus]
MPKSEKEEILSTLSARIFSAMLDELIQDATLQSHHEITRSRAVCKALHTPPSLAAVSQAAPSLSRPATPSSVGESKTINGNSTTGNNTPTSIKDGNLYLDCISCSRQIASNRYAPHLSTCLGLSTTRRAPARGAAMRYRPSDVGRSASPVSETGNGSDDKPLAKTKGKTKAKRADDSEISLKRKRPAVPQVSPNKKAKKLKPSASPVSRIKADPDASLAPPTSGIHYSPSTGSQSKIPSKLRDSSTASFLDRSSTSSSSRSPSPGGVSVGTAASSFSTQSPSLTARSLANGKSMRGRATGTGPPRRPSPPRPPPIHVPDYTMDIDGGEETGSSTDTDSS